VFRQIDARAYPGSSICWAARMSGGGVGGEGGSGKGSVGTLMYTRGRGGLGGQIHTGSGTRSEGIGSRSPPAAWGGIVQWVLSQLSIGEWQCVL